MCITSREMFDLVEKSKTNAQRQYHIDKGMILPDGSLPISSLTYDDVIKLIKAKAENCFKYYTIFKGVLSQSIVNKLLEDEYKVYYLSYNSNSYRFIKTIVDWSDNKENELYNRYQRLHKLYRDYKAAQNWNILKFFGKDHWVLKEFYKEINNNKVDEEELQRLDIENLKEVMNDYLMKKDNIEKAVIR